MKGANAMLERFSEGIVQCGRKITVEELAEIKETVELFPNLSRTELAETLCENLQWLTASGGHKNDACLKLLSKLEAEGIDKLPEKRKIHISAGRPKAILRTKRTAPQSDIVCSLRELGPVNLQTCNDRKSSGLWNEYVWRYHYLGYKKPFGTFLKYFIVCDIGVLGCLLFAGAAKALGVRDKWIGWGENQRLRNLAWVINNSRFLIFPWIRVKNLASHVLGQAVRRVKDDWNERWGYGPVLLETFVDPERYHGRCYKASNWEKLGMTPGKGLIRKGKKYTTTPKLIFVKPLAKGFRSLLCSDHLKGRVEG
jgi:hypothetical protein